MWKSVKTLDDADGHIEIYFLNFCVLKEYKKWEVNMKSLKRNMAWYSPLHSFPLFRYLFERKTHAHMQSREEMLPVPDLAWAGLGLEPGIQPRSPCGCQEPSNLSHHCCLPGSAAAGHWNQELVPALEPRHSDMQWQAFRLLDHIPAYVIKLEKFDLCVAINNHVEDLPR